MAQSCPISFNRIDAHLVRIVALQVIVVALFLISTGNLFFAALLLFDFLVRTLNLKKLSPFTKVAKLLIKGFSIKPQLCDEAPKRFALYLGLGIIGFFTLLFLFGFSKVATVLVTILIICASLEAAFDYCIGCKIYHYLQMIVPKK